MSTQQQRRLAAGLSQQSASTRAGVSLASWRRWEANPDQVSEEIRHACERALEARTVDVRMASAWQKDGRLTPRQAAAIIHSLRWWGELELDEWLRHRTEPLHDVGPFPYLDRRVMMLVGDSAPFADATRERCMAIAEEIEAAVLPFDRPGCYLDEVLMGAVLPCAEAMLTDETYLFEDIPAQVGTFGTQDSEVDLDDVSDEDYQLGDDDWDVVSDGFDDACEWDDWEVPRNWSPPHPLLRPILQERPPFEWFDVIPPGPTMIERVTDMSSNGDDRL